MEVEARLSILYLALGKILAMPFSLREDLELDRGIKSIRIMVPSSISLQINKNSMHRFLQKERLLFLSIPLLFFIHLVEIRDLTQLPQSIFHQ